MAGSTRSLRPSKLAAACLAGAMTLSLVAVVHGDDFGTGPPDTGWFADGSGHSFCLTTGFNMGDVARFAMDDSLDADTDMHDIEDSSCGSETDVWFFEGDLPTGTRGQYICQIRNGVVCISADVTLDKAEIDIGSFDWEDRRKTACHEVGHSVGLQHGDGKFDCMINGEIPDQGAEWRHYSGHHIGHIDDRY